MSLWVWQHFNGYKIFPLPLVSMLFVTANFTADCVMKVKDHRKRHKACRGKHVAQGASCSGENTTVWSMIKNRAKSLAINKRSSPWKGQRYEKGWFWICNPSCWTKPSKRAKQQRNTLKAHPRTCRAQYPRGFLSQKQITITCVSRNINKPI